MNIKIREITLDDGHAVAGLSSQLGYEVNEKSLRAQIMAILNHKDHFAFVAVKEESIIGFIHGFLTLRLTSGPFLEIGGLIISETERRQGIGKILVQYLESAVACKEVRVRCNIKRASAHKFYYELGYSESKTQKVFTKCRSEIKSEQG